MGNLKYIEKLREVAYSRISQLQELNTEKQELRNDGEKVKYCQDIFVVITSAEHEEDKWHEEKHHIESKHDLVEFLRRLEVDINDLLRELLLIKF